MLGGQSASLDRTSKMQQLTEQANNIRVVTKSCNTKLFFYVLVFNFLCCWRLMNVHTEWPPIGK